MLKLRNLTLLRRIYVNLLALMTRIVYGWDVRPGRRGNGEDAGPGAARIRRINSELEFGPGEWEGAFLDPLQQPRPQASRDALAARAPVQSASLHPRSCAEHSPSVSSDSEGHPLPLQLEDASVCIADGIDAIVGDSLTRCFTSEPPEPWNFLTRNLPPGQWQLSPYMTLLWVVGLWVRYCVLLPVRVVILVSGLLSFLIAYSLVGFVLPPYGNIQTVVRKWLLRYLASVFVASWSGYIRFHGNRPTKQANQIYVANHTSLIDVFVLVKDYNFSCIGQRHTGLAGMLQDLLVTAQDHVWFDREEGRDRKAVQRLLKNHVLDSQNEPMLVFPEGTCTTTEYCVMFKKGSFELGAKVYPIAMKYRKEFGDAYWNSQTASFPRHLFDLMTSWAVVCDVYYLEPMEKMAGESPVQFAGRVKQKICQKADLINVNWDGFLKRHRISPKFLVQRQKAFAAVIMRRLKGDIPRPFSTSTLCVMGKNRPAALPDVSKSETKHSRDADAEKEQTRSAEDMRNGELEGCPRASAMYSQARYGTELSQTSARAAALSAAAHDAIRWAVAISLLVIAGTTTAMLFPTRWKNTLAWEKLFGAFA